MVLVTRLAMLLTLPSVTRLHDTGRPIGAKTARSGNNAGLLSDNKGVFLRVWCAI